MLCHYLSDLGNIGRRHQSLQSGMLSALADWVLSLSSSVPADTEMVPKKTVEQSLDMEGQSRDCPVSKAERLLLATHPSSISVVNILTYSHKCCS